MIRPVRLIARILEVLGLVVMLYAFVMTNFFDSQVTVVNNIGFVGLAIGFCMDLCTAKEP